MNVSVLISAVVRQVMVLVAQLATAAGMRAPLAHLANQIFLDLVRELQAQGVGTKVIADMFGLTLRGYHAKMRRLSESRTERDRSLWEAVLGFVRERQVLKRDDIIRRFHLDEERVVRGVLNDLSGSGLIYSAGRGDRTVYRAVPVEELGVLSEDASAEALANIVWVLIDANDGIGRDDIAAVLGVEAETLDSPLEWLLERGRITAADRAGEPVYTSEHCTIGYGEAIGWEAAVFDHVQALVVAIVMKLSDGVTHAEHRDATGGSTYELDVWPGHPMEREAIGLLARSRDLASDLRNRIDAFNRTLAEGERPAARTRIRYYVGQSVLVDDPDDSLDGALAAPPDPPPGGDA